MWIVTSPSTVGTLRALTGALFLLLCVWASLLFLFFAPYIAPLFCFTHLPLYAYFRVFACQFLTVLCALPRFDSRDGTVLDTAKYHWLQGREVWTFSRLWVRVGVGVAKYQLESVTQRGVALAHRVACRGVARQCVWHGVSWRHASFFCDMFIPTHATPAPAPAPTPTSTPTADAFVQQGTTTFKLALPKE